VRQSGPRTRSAAMISNALRVITEDERQAGKANALGG
jgi:hypothetical protein